MSKSMWCDAENSLPISDHDNPYGEVLFWVEGANRPYWGRYDHTINLWCSSDKVGYSPYYEPYRVKYFAYIDNPYK